MCIRDRYQYLLPRLAGMWTHLERQKGGIGLRGPGETEIEKMCIRDRPIPFYKAGLKEEDMEMIKKRNLYIFQQE